MKTDKSDVYKAAINKSLNQHWTKETRTFSCVAAQAHLLQYDIRSMPLTRSGCGRNATQRAEDGYR